MRTLSVAVYKNDCQPDIQLSISCLHEFILPTLSSCLSFSLSISNITCLSFPLSQLLILSLFPFFPHITPPQSSTASQGVSFNLSSFSGYFCFPLPLYFLPLPFAFVHLTFLFRVNTAAFSHLAMYQFVWTGNSSFSLTWVSSHHPFAFIFIPSLFTSSLCAFLCLLLPV